METENQKIAANVIEIKQQISSMFRLPVAKEVSRIFLEKVEIERPCYSFGMDVWIQAGKWWLNKVNIPKYQTSFWTRRWYYQGGKFV
jgi:hypothetical protein